MFIDYQATSDPTDDTACARIKDLLERRTAYLQLSQSQEVIVPKRLKASMVDGVITVKSARGGSHRVNFPTAQAFSKDLQRVLEALDDPWVQAFASSRLAYVDRAFQLHLSHNGERESEEVKNTKQAQAAHDRVVEVLQRAVTKQLAVDR